LSYFVQALIPQKPNPDRSAASLACSTFFYIVTCSVITKPYGDARGGSAAVPDLSAYWPIAAAFFALVAAGIGAPIPEELPTIGAGVWVGTNPDLGPLRWLILPVCFVGVLISDVLLYSIGRLFGPRLLKYKWVQRWYPPETREKTERNFHSYGLKVLLMVRWIPAIRSPLFVTAGLMRLPLPLFVLADGIAAAFGHSLLFFLGYWFGDQVKELVLSAERTLGQTVRILLVLGLLVGIAIYFAVHFCRRPVITGDPHEVPIIGEKVAERLSSSSLCAPPSRSDQAHDVDGVSSNSAHSGRQVTDKSGDSTSDASGAPSG
jgi:membrane protein DedA with SNARE-associated domain